VEIKGGSDMLFEQSNPGQTQSKRNQKFTKFAVIPNPNSATFVFETLWPCQPIISVYPGQSASEEEKAIAGNAQFSRPPAVKHIFRAPGRPGERGPSHEAQLAQGQTYRFTVIAPDDSETLETKHAGAAIITGQFTTGFRDACIGFDDLSIFHDGASHHFDLLVAAYRDIDGRLGDWFIPTFDITPDGEDYFRDPLSGLVILAGGVSDKIAIYAKGWGRCVEPLTTLAERPDSFFKPPVGGFPDAPAQDESLGDGDRQVGYAGLLPAWS
jgi:hypothetical protein